MTSKNVYGTEDALQKMVELTTKENYLQVVNYIDSKDDIKKHELDLSMYITEIACKEYQELIPIIKKKLHEYIDRDAVEDLENALIKLNHD